LATLGFKLVITGRDEQRIRNVVENCKKLSKQKVIGVKTDLLKDNEIKSLVQTTITEFQRIDLLINGANITIRCSITDPNIMESYDKVINTNVRSVLLLTSLVVPHLQTSKGSIINLISDSGLKPVSRTFYLMLQFRCFNVMDVWMYGCLDVWMFGCMDV
jgi:NADP-dependent 3-hydroxy acid dehydrogenase YdfG